MGCCRSFCRTTTEFFSSILLLCAVALLSFGGILLYKWRSDAQTQGSPPPGYVLGLLGLGAGMAASNLLAFLGACTKSKCCLSMSSILSFGLLFAQIILAMLLFLNPAAIDQQVCPPGDAACLAKLDNLFKDPGAHAGVLLAFVCGVQAVALFSVCCLQTLQQRKDGRDQEEAGQLEQDLLEEHQWSERREAVEGRARRKMDGHRAALSQTARDIIAKRESPNHPLTKAGLPPREDAVL